MLVGCGTPTKEIESTVQVFLQEHLSTKLQEYALHVERVEAVKRENGDYFGIATVNYGGEAHHMLMTITVNRKKEIIFQLDKDSLRFLR